MYAVQNSNELMPPNVAKHKVISAFVSASKFLMGFPFSFQRYAPEFT